LNKSQEDKILQALEEKTILYLEIEARDNEINYLNNKLMESFRLTQSLMETNEKLQDKVLTLSKKIDTQAIEIGKLQKDLEIKTSRLRAFQIATVVTSTIIVLKFFVM
jgi:peptidoglycan hydrolase CwlO-like protein